MKKTQCKGGFQNATKLLSVVVGSMVGGITFYPLTIPISLTIIPNLDSESLETAWWLIPVIGAIFGGYVGKKKPSFDHTTISIIFWSIVLFGIIWLDIGACFSIVLLMGLGNTSTAIDLWIFAGIVMMVGVIAGAVMGGLIALIRFTINKL